MPQPAGVALSPLAQAAGGTSVTFGGDELCSGFLRPRPVSKNSTSLLVQTTHECSRWNIH